MKNGLTAGAITLDATTGNANVGNIVVTGKSNLNSISNVTITGGTSGYVIQTDGTGNLSFVNLSATSTPAPMPTYVDVGNTLLISANYQGLFGYPITIDGTMTVDGILIDVNDSSPPAGSDKQVQFNDTGNTAGNANLTFNKSTATLTTVIVKTTPVTVSNLPSASTTGAGSRAFVTDANTTTFLAIVGSGGSNSVPVVSNGTNWIVG